MRFQLALSAVCLSGMAAAQHLDLISATSGSGQLLPHRILEIDGSGNPTTNVVDIRSFHDLAENLTPSNGVLPTPHLTTTPVLPNGQGGNHYLSLRFTRDLDVDSILDSSVGGAATSGLLGSIVVLAIEPVSGTVLPVQGRAFVGGQTYAGTPVGGQFELQSWVSLSGGQVVTTNVDNNGDNTPDGTGFPGTQSSFAGDTDLVSRRTFVFVADTDGDLTTHETFPQGFVIAVRATSAVQDRQGGALSREVFSSCEVGQGVFPPEVFHAAGNPIIDPTDGSVNVDPMAPVRIRFTESIQPKALGPLAGSVPNLGAVQLGFGSPTTQMATTARPESVFDLATWFVRPSRPFPGSGTTANPFNQVSVEVAPNSLEDLDGNGNFVSVSTSFQTGDGPGIVNAPVAPDVVLSSGLNGVGVVDLNGYGAGTGSPRYTQNPAEKRHSHTNFPDNPNVAFQGLGVPGTTTLDGGSAGVLTLTKDTNLDEELLRAPSVVRATDMGLGRSLDVVYNNANFPFGCQAGGGNICSLDGLQVFSPIPTGPNTIGPGAANPLQLTLAGGNPISWAPHPNPPPMSYPPQCLSPLLGDEPTSVDAPQINLLVPGDPFGDPSIGIPPSGLLTPEQNAWFVGPSVATQLGNCQTYALRQQVGHFLYIADRARDEVVAVNSNTMVVVDRIPVSDPNDIAIGPNLDFLAVSQTEVGQVTFIDINPASATFHEVVKTTTVGARPTGIAWDGSNEDILVCNTGGSSISVISAFNLEVRKTVTGFLTRPLDVAITPRQDAFGFQRGVYFGYIIQADGSVAIFESGPGGINGWGYDDVIGLLPFTFHNPKAVQPDPNDLSSSVWIAHEGVINVATGQAAPPGTGAVSRVGIDSAITGIQVLTANNVNTPQFRNIQFDVHQSIGEPTLSGIPTDLAFDDQRNFGGLRGHANVFSAGFPVEMNSKGLVRMVQPGQFQGVSEPQFVFAATGDHIDVLHKGVLLPQDVNPFEAGTQSIEARRVRTLAHYFRQ